MSRPPLLDDELCEIVLAGTGPVPHGLWGLAAFAEDARELRASPAPVPDAVLRAMFDAPARPRVVGSGRIRQRASAGARVAVGVSAAFMALTGAAAAGVLPSPAQHAVATVVNSVSPFPDLPDTSSHDAVVTSGTSSGTSPGTTTGSHPGASRSPEPSSLSSPSSPAAATAAVAAIADPAPSATASENPPEWAPPSGVVDPPGQSGDTGQDRAAITPAGERGNSDPPGKAKGHDKS
ncbi:MAG TPA: hypothetical protein VFZ17_00660 [Acidimicrobiia bacterium]|nr:hypothetical protein [Acidimicrobiia bacterium]